MTDRKNFEALLDDLLGASFDQDWPAEKKARAAVLQAFDEAAGREGERERDALEQIRQWAQAYPLAVFPEPDFAKAHELLKAGGMTLDAISASNMRHVITQVQKIVDAAMSGEAQG